VDIKWISGYTEAERAGKTDIEISMVLLLSLRTSCLLRGDTANPQLSAAWWGLHGPQINARADPTATPGDVWLSGLPCHIVVARLRGGSISLFRLPLSRIHAERTQTSSLTDSDDLRSPPSHQASPPSPVRRTGPVVTGRAFPSLDPLSPSRALRTRTNDGSPDGPTERRMKSLTRLGTGLLALSMRRRALTTTLANDDESATPPCHHS
jgi:hypothetical protein